MKSTIKYLGTHVARLLAPLLFDRRLLVGRHFEQSNVGWRWVLSAVWFQKLLGFNRRVPWPISPQSRISDPSRVTFHPDDLNNFQSPGCYFQNFAGTIVIGRGTYIAPNVGIITANHNPSNLDRHLDGQDVTIGECCWIGMNSVILPGVTLGPSTIVGAGSVVTKSFPNGHCIVAGNPARLLRETQSSESQPDPMNRR